MSRARDIADIGDNNIDAIVGASGITLGGTTINDWADVGGKFLQVQSTDSTTSVAMSNAANAWVDLSGLSVTITPSSASSKILITASVCAGQGPSNPYAIWFRLTRDGTPVGVGNSTNSRSEVSFALVPIGTYMDDDMGTAGFTYLDSPSTTSAITYKIQGTSRAVGDWAYNMSDDQSDSGAFAQGISTITAMEVGA